MKDELKNEIDLLRKERIELKNKFSTVNLEVKSILDRLCNDVGKTMVSWGDFSKIPMGEMFAVNEKVNILKFFQDEKNIKFKTFMQPGATMGLQDHDIDERVFVVFGNLIEETRSDKVYTKGDYVFYKAFEKHKPKSDTESEYEVIFTKKP